MNLITEKIRCIQHEYKNLLAEFLKNSDNGLTPANLDEICLFWFRHIKTIDIFMKNNIRDKNTYVFTGSTFIDFNDGQHLPYLLVGDFHIFDDPLSRYANKCIAMEGTSYSDKLLDQVTITVENNLKLLTDFGDYIIIVPFRFLRLDKNSDALYQLSEDIFVNLFSNINDLEDYFKRIRTVQDISDYLNDTGKNILFFSKSIECESTLSKKIELLLSSLPESLDDYKTPGSRFYAILFGSITQSLDIVISCTTYNCTPFVNNPQVIHYINLIIYLIGRSYGISDNFLKKVNQAHYLSRSFDFRFFDQIDISDFTAVRDRYDFYRTLNLESDKVCSVGTASSLSELNNTVENVLSDFKNEFL